MNTEKDNVFTTFSTLESSLKKAEQKVDLYVNPVRKSIFKRFPVFFSLFVTFGVSCVFLGFEKLIERIPFLYEHPILILTIGIAVLGITGTLYKKL